MKNTILSDEIVKNDPTRCQRKRLSFDLETVYPRKKRSEHRLAAKRHTLHMYAACFDKKDLCRHVLFLIWSVSTSIFILPKSEDISSDYLNSK